MTTSALFSYAFRPFFLSGSLYSILAILLWVLTLHGSGLSTISPFWHGHEMLVGFSMAAIAGFSLTAVSVWTDRPALNGTPVAWLVFLWLAGRLAMLFAGNLPPALVAMVDMLFPLLFCLLLSREIVAGKSKRNYILIAATACLVLFNGVYHLGANHLLAGGERLAVYLLIHTVLLLVSIIAGRIIPAFTGNWLRKQGQKKLPVNSDITNKLALWSTVWVGISASIAPGAAITGILALLASVAHAVRLGRWRGLATTSNPLLFVLHVAYTWLPIGYALLGCAVFSWVFTPTAALHALTMGAIGSIILAVTTRVSLGHTGRPLVAARATIWAYYLLTIAVVIRVLGPISGLEYLRVVDLTAATWMLSFMVFLWVYWPVLTRPKAS